VDNWLTGCKFHMWFIKEICIIGKTHDKKPLFLAFWCFCSSHSCQKSVLQLPESGSKDGGQYLTSLPLVRASETKMTNDSCIFCFNVNRKEKPHKSANILTN
jgi:hypothetical protein